MIFFSQKYVFLEFLSPCCQWCDGGVTAPSRHVASTSDRQYRVVLNVSTCVSAAICMCVLYDTAGVGLLDIGASFAVQWSTTQGTGRTNTINYSYTGHLSSLYKLCGVTEVGEWRAEDLYSRYWNGSHMGLICILYCHIKMSDICCVVKNLMFFCNTFRLYFIRP